MEVLRDAVWTFVGVVVAIVALVVAIYGIKKQVVKKSLIYSVRNQWPALLLTDEGNAHRIKIFVDGEEVQSAYTADVQIRNNGTYPISIFDFVAPIKITFSDSARLFSAQVLEVSPTDLQVSTSIDGSQLTIEPLLLNPKDSITLRFLYESSQNETITLAARITGISAINRVKAEDILRPYRWLNTVVDIFAIFGAIVILVGTAKLIWSANVLQGAVYLMRSLVYRSVTGHWPAD